MGLKDIGLYCHHIPPNLFQSDQRGIERSIRQPRTYIAGWFQSDQRGIESTQIQTPADLIDIGFNQTSVGLKANLQGSEESGDEWFQSDQRGIERPIWWVLGKSSTTFQSDQRGIERVAHVVTDGGVILVSIRPAWD